MEAVAKGQKMEGQLGMAGSLRMNAIESVVRLVVRIKPAIVTNRQSRSTRFTRDSLDFFADEGSRCGGLGDLGFLMSRLTTIALWCDGMKVLVESE